MAAIAKPVFVRVKRKQSHEPLDAFWLEINERPQKKPLLDFARLSISESTLKEDPKSKKVLVQHVETTADADVVTDLLESLLPDSGDPGALRKKIEERRSILKQNIKQSNRAIAIQKHEEFARTARFEQIWKSRREKGQQDEKMIHKICDVYDVVRVDSDDELPKESHELKDAEADNDEMFSNYLPLLREFLPDAATEIESNIAQGQDGYVYDIYTVEEETNKNDEDSFTEYPLVQVEDADEDFYDGQSDPEYDSEDSNAENGDLHDYPDEESSQDEGEGEGEDEEEEEEEEEDEDEEDKDKERDWERDEFDEQEYSYIGFEDVNGSMDEEGDDFRWQYR